MDAIVLFQDKWSHTPHVPAYLFFGGLASGTFLVALLADLCAARARRAAVTARIAAYAVVPLLALAGIALTSHLGKPERGLAFPVFFTNYESWMTRGGWVVGAGAPLMIAYAALWYFGVNASLRRVTGFVAMVPAAALGLYTGYLLSGAGFVPLWSREHLPLLFLSSGVNTGLALAAILTLLAWPWLGPRDTGPRPILRWLGAILLVFVLVEGFELYRFMRDVASQGLLMGHTGRPTTDRFQYQPGAGGALQPGASYVALVTWVNNATGAEEGASAETVIHLGSSETQVTVTTPLRPGLTYNVYFGPSLREARLVAATLAPGESAVIRDLTTTGLGPPENLQTGGRFIAAAGGPIAYRYVTGGPEYPWRLLRGTSAEATLSPLRGFLPSPTLVQDAPHGVTLAGWFWFGVVGLALVLPVALTVLELVAELGGNRAANTVAVVKCLSVLAGGLILRFVIVWGGDLKAPLAFPPAKWPVPLPGGTVLPLPGVLPPGLGG